MNILCINWCARIYILLIYMRHHQSTLKTIGTKWQFINLLVSGTLEARHCILHRQICTHTHTPHTHTHTHTDTDRQTDRHTRARARAALHTRGQAPRCVQMNKTTRTSSRGGTHFYHARQDSWHMNKKTWARLEQTSTVTPAKRSFAQPPHPLSLYE